MLCNAMLLALKLSPLEGFGLPTDFHALFRKAESLVLEFEYKRGAFGPSIGFRSHFFASSRVGWDGCVMEGGLSDDSRIGSRSNIGYWPHVTKIATPIPPSFSSCCCWCGIESNQTWETEFCSIQSLFLWFCPDCKIQHFIKDRKNWTHGRDNRNLIKAQGLMIKFEFRTW